MGTSWIVSDNLPVERIINTQPTDLELTHKDGAGIKRILTACAQNKDWSLSSLSVDTSNIYDLTDTLTTLIKEKTTLKTVRIGKHCLEDLNPVLSAASQSKSLTKVEVELFDLDVEKTAQKLAGLRCTFDLKIACPSKEAEIAGLISLFEKHKYTGRCTDATLPILLAFAGKIEVLHIEGPFVEASSNMKATKSTGTIKRKLSGTISRGRTITRSMTTRSLMPVGMTQSASTIRGSGSRKRKRAEDVFREPEKRQKSQDKSLVDKLRDDLENDLKSTNDANKKLALHASISKLNVRADQEDPILQLARKLQTFENLGELKFLPQTYEPLQIEVVASICEASIPLKLLKQIGILQASKLDNKVEECLKFLMAQEDKKLI